MAATFSPLRRLSMLAAALAGSALAGPTADVALPPANQVRAVWNLGSQPCNGGLANSYTRHPDEKQVRQSKRLEVPRLGYAFRVPQIPAVTETVVKLHLDDRSRGVVDHYFLISDQDLAPPIAAIVITELPEEVIRDHKAFEAVRILQSGLAGAVGLRPELQEITGPYGAALELLVPDRVGTDCFPTSEFQLVPPAHDAHSLGISRFVVVDDQLIEFSVILKRESAESSAAVTQRARAFMDAFWLVLEKLPAKP